MTDELPEQQNVSNSSTPSQTSTDPSLTEGAVSLPPAIANINIFSSGGLSLLCQSVDFCEISFKEVCLFISYTFPNVDII